MIEKLKWQSVEDVRQQAREIMGDKHGLFDALITHPLPPTEGEIINKINELIEHINELESK